MELENWKDIVGYIGYQISDIGNVRSFWRRTGDGGDTFNNWEWKITDKSKLLSIGKNRGGYHMVRLQKSQGVQKFVTVHKLMLESFVGPRPSPKHHAAHIDDDKDNNALENLEWATSKKNLQDRFKNHGGEKLTKADIPKIRSMLNDGMTQTAVAIHFGVDQSHISRIKSSLCWHYI